MFEYDSGGVISKLLQLSNLEVGEQRKSLERLVANVSPRVGIVRTRLEIVSSFRLTLSAFRLRLTRAKQVVPMSWLKNQFEIMSYIHVVNRK